MALKKIDKEFRLPKISYLDFKVIEMDRVLTALFARLLHNGCSSRLTRRFDVTVKDFVDEVFLRHPEWFDGFGEHRDIVERWIETHLMDMVNRGKPNQAIASPRPLHGYIYRFRNPKHSRDYGASQQVYEFLDRSRQSKGQKALEHLKAFFFTGVDLNTQDYDTSNPIDVETQALLRLKDQVTSDAADKNREQFPPLCIGAADLLADDILCLLVYKKHIPRSVMVEYLKILMAFHMALYHLRLMKLLPSLVKKQGPDPICARDKCPMDPRDKEYCPQKGCPHQVSLVVDVANTADTHMASLAERSVDYHYRRIPAFLKAYFTTKKLDEFVRDLSRMGKINAPAGGLFTVGDILRFLTGKHKDERERYFENRVLHLLPESVDGVSDTDPQLQELLDMKLPYFETYIEYILALRGRYHRRFMIDCLDALLLKNRPGAAITQPRTRNSPRRFVLDSRLLEVLLQVAVLRPGGKNGFHTEEIRIEDLLTFLRERYGIHIDRLPGSDGFDKASITDCEALRRNLEAFRRRLRELGFYRDLSDAYITQIVTPRYLVK